MENLGGLVGVAVAIAMNAYFNSAQSASWTRRAGVFVLSLVVAGIAAAAASYGGAYLRGWQNRPAQIEKAMAQARQQPLIGAVLRNFPDAEADMRRSLEADYSDRDAQPSHAFQAGLRLRRLYVTPALMRADDSAVIGVNEAQGQLLSHLQRTNLRACREATTTGIQRWDLLDSTGRELFQKMTASVEAAFVSGLPRMAVAVTPLKAEQAGLLLAEAGFTAVDFAALEKLPSLGDAEACTVGLRLSMATAKLPTAKRADLARFLLTN